MKVHSVEFVKSVADLQGLPKDGLPEVAVAGRSNVGKSSLLNALFARKRLARTSSTPGKTRYLNYFCVDRRFYLVDLPGYGYARVSKREAAQWRALIERYITESPHLRGVIVLIDSRLGPTELDRQLLAWLDGLDVPRVVVATKSDKLSRGALLSQLGRYAAALEPVYRGKIVPFSATTGQGNKEVWRALLTLLE